VPVPRQNLNRPVLIILRHFPKLKAAEHEVVKRIEASASELGWNARLVDVDRNFDFKKIELIEKDADLVIDIHYEYPKFLKPRSIGAFWTPTSFMKDWDLAYAWENQLSHDHLVHTDSEKIVQLVRSYRPDENFAILNHTIPLSWQEWVSEATRNITPRAFYAGINWSKLSGRQGRHQRFFELLDDQNALDIYGPKKIGHVIPWEGFKSYRGEIPFDGKSILRCARQSGISLVLSAEQHFREGVISSRLFEGLVAGNAIIADRHPFIVKHFGSNARYLNFDKGDEYAAKQLLDYIVEFRSDKSVLEAAQNFSDEIFAQKFNLTHQLSAVLSTANSNSSDFLDLPVLLVGPPNSQVNAHLRAIGFSKIECTDSELFDLHDVRSTAKSFGMSEFIVFSTKTNFLDGLAERVVNLFQRMASEGAELGVIKTVALTQDNRNFQPLVMPVEKSFPLNGLIVRGEYEAQRRKTIVDDVPALRVRSVQDIAYINPATDTFSVLLNAAAHTNEGNPSSLSIRKLVNLELDKLGESLSSDIGEDIRRLPKARKTAVILALAAAIPGAKPFAAIAKWYYRRTK